MIELEFKGAEIKRNIQGDYDVTLKVPGDNKYAVLALNDAAKKDASLVAKIGQKKKKRSLDANAYAWVLINKIAVEMSKEYPVTPLEVYRTLIPGVGDNFVIVPVREDALQQWIKNWESEPSTKMGWVVKVLGPAKKHPGYINTVNYYGSSTYDTKQMSRLIDLIVDICRDYSIETMTPREIEQLKSEWR